MKLRIVLLCLLWITSLASPLRPASPQTKYCCNKTYVLLLGTGTPLSEPDRSGSAIAVVVDGTPYLVDAGPGVVRRIQAAEQAGLPGGNVSRFKTVFFTHLHSDHTLGYPDLLLSPWVLGRSSGLQVYGPKGIAAMTKNLLAAYTEDIQIRSSGLEHEDPIALTPRVHEIVPGMVYHDEKVKVYAFRVAHGEFQDAFGYRFETADRTIVISGDTAPTDTIVTNCHRCDVLVHEVYSTKGASSRPKQVQNYHSHYHTSSVELGEIAARAHPGLLVLYHELLWDNSQDQLKSEMEAAYTGKFAIGHDLEVY